MNPYEYSPDRTKRLYYTEDFSIFPFRLLYQLLNQEVPFWLAFPYAVLFKCLGQLGISPKASHARGAAGSEKVVPFEELPAEAKLQTAADLESLMDLNYSPFRFRIFDTIGPVQITSIDLLSPDRRTVACVVWICVWNAKKTRHEVSIELNSFSNDDPEYTTMWTQPEIVRIFDALKLPFMDLVAFQRTLPLSSAIDSHQERVEGKPLYVLNEHDAGTELERRNQRRFEAYLARRFHRRLSEQEIRNLMTAPPMPR